jgi:hypothetical protein
LSDFSKGSELLTLALFSSIFGGWIGIFFNENDGLPFHEIVMYYVQHVLASFGGPLILLMCGRYNLFDWMHPIYINGGFIYFTIYMRFVLCPVSLYTWANLNHTLCNDDLDPFFTYFKMDQNYYYWAELYLLFYCYAFVTLNLITVKVFSLILCFKDDKATKDDGN